MTRYRATLAYDGTAYNGYQLQPDQPTIQGMVEETLQKILGVPTRVMAAGRTDTGVHAIGQVIAFDAEWHHGDQQLLKALNANLPEDIALQDIIRHEGFHPRFDALSRVYRYQIAEVNIRQPLLIKRAWQMHDKLDDSALQIVAEMLIGKHDFASFGTPPKGENTTRTIFHSAWHTQSLPVGRMLIYEVSATAFLLHMVRRLVGMQVAVGRGRITADEFAAIFHSKDLSRCKWLAPPQGLTLVEVRYPPPDIYNQHSQATQSFDV